jgi:putative toxin-antitoxin system antitoxin component (TIGR02293 family)
MTMEASRIAESLGGSAVLQKEIRSDLDLADAISSGMPAQAAEAALQSGLITLDEMHRLVISRRRLTRTATLSPGESNRLARVIGSAIAAETALGDQTRAFRWMRMPNRALRGRRPIDLLDSEIGARVVVRLLGRIEHGVYS